MHQIFELHAPTPPPRPFWRGRVHRAAIDISDRIDVVVPDFDENLVWKGCRWQSRDLTTMPHKGDTCLVVLDHTNEPWVIAWWPFVT